MDWTRFILHVFMQNYVSMLTFTQLQNLLLLLCFMQIQHTRKPPACQWRWTTQTDNNANDTSSVASAPWQNRSRNAWIPGGRVGYGVPKCVCVWPCAISKQCKLLHVPSTWFNSNLQHYDNYLVHGTHTTPILLCHNLLRYTSTYTHKCSFWSRCYRTATNLYTAM